MKSEITHWNVLDYFEITAFDVLIELEYDTKQLTLVTREEGLKMVGKLMGWEKIIKENSTMIRSIPLARTGIGQIFIGPDNTNSSKESAVLAIKYHQKPVCIILP